MPVNDSPAARRPVPRYYIRELGCECANHAARCADCGRPFRRFHVHVSTGGFISAYRERTVCPRCADAAGAC